MAGPSMRPYPLPRLTIAVASCCAPTDHLPPRCGPIQAYLACPGRVAGMRRVGFGVLSSRSRRVFPTESAAIAHHHCGGAWPAPPVWPVRNQTSLSCLARRQSPPAPREN